MLRKNRGFIFRFFTMNQIGPDHLFILPRNKIGLFVIHFIYT